MRGNGDKQQFETLAIYRVIVGKLHFIFAIIEENLMNNYQVVLF